MKLKCDTCVFLLAKHDSGFIPIESGSFHVKDPYVTCSKIHYAVLQVNTHKCPEYKER